MKSPREAKKSFWNILLGPSMGTHFSRFDAANDIPFVMSAILDFQL